MEGSDLMNKELVDLVNSFDNDEEFIITVGGADADADQELQTE